MTIISLSLPEGWEILYMKRVGPRSHVALGRSDVPAELPLVVVEEYPEYIQDAVSEAIDGWGNAQ